MEISKRKLKSLMVCAYTHGLNEMYRDEFFEWQRLELDKLEIGQNGGEENEDKTYDK